jgi:hypothetical protein
MIGLFALVLPSWRLICKDHVARCGEINLSELLLLWTDTVP